MFENTIAKTIDTSNSPHSGLIAIAALGGFALVIGFFFYLIARQKKAMAALAQQKGWQTLGTDDATLGNYVPTYLRNNPDSAGHKYQMAYQAQGIVFFRYDDSIRSHNITDNTNTQLQVVSYAIAALGLSQAFGQILILHHSRLNNYGLHNGLQKFNLEGDFGKYFDVYAPQGSSIETLSFLTPDVMAYLIDLGQHSHWSIEINGNLVIVEGDANLISPSKIANLLDYAGELQQKLSRKPIV